VERHPVHGNAVPGGHAEAEAKGGKRPGWSNSRPLVAVPAPCGNESQQTRAPLPSLSQCVRPALEFDSNKHASRSPANLVETGNPTTVSRHAWKSRLPDAVRLSTKKAETFIDHHAIGSRAPSLFQPATPYTLDAVSECSAGPREAAFSCCPPAPRLERRRAARGGEGLSILPTSHFQRNHDNPTFPIQQKPLALPPAGVAVWRPPVSEFSIYTGTDRQVPGRLSSTIRRVWGGGRSDQRFCCARRDSVCPHLTREEQTAVV
jgi:hypothetical protein